MSMKTLNKEILAELQELTKNKKIKIKDILEWSTGTVEAEENEVVIQLKRLAIQVCIKKELNLNVPTTRNFNC